MPFPQTLENGRLVKMNGNYLFPFAFDKFLFVIRIDVCNATINQSRQMVFR